MITKVSEQILSRLGGHWHHPPAWENTPELADLKQQARAVIEKDFALAEVWGWKDPMTCFTLPFWQQLLPSMRYVICLRSPLDVARSLERRNGFSLEKDFHLWLLYTKFALKHTIGQPRIFVFSEDWIGWPAFWWLDYYQGLNRYLFLQFPCVLHNDRLIVFDLRSGAGSGIGPR